MLYFTYSLAELRAKPTIAFKGAIVCDTNSEKFTRYLIKEVSDGIPILIEIGDKHKTALPNWIGDYMLNLRTGYISVIDSGEHHISNPLTDMKMDDYALSLIRKDFNIL